MPTITQLYTYMRIPEHRMAVKRRQRGENKIYSAFVTAHTHGKPTNSWISWQITVMIESTDGCLVAPQRLDVCNYETFRSVFFVVWIQFWWMDKWTFAIRIRSKRQRRWSHKIWCNCTEHIIQLRGVGIIRSTQDVSFRWSSRAR